MSSQFRRNLLERALAAIRDGRIEEAQALNNRLLAVEPRDPAAHQLAATLALQRGQFDDADRWANSGLELRADHVPTLVLAGRIARGVGDVPRAIRRFGRASELSPDQPQPLFLLCACQIQSGAPEAGALLARLSAKFPGDAEGWREIGDTLQRSGKSHTAAIAAYRRALAAQPELFEVRLKLGSCLRHMGEPGEARIEFERAIAGNPTDSRGWFSFGLALDDLGDRDGAVAAYRKATLLAPELPEAHVNLGLGLQHTGDLAAMRPDGYFHITGRLKDMIIRGGENIYPREIEEFFYTHPAVADVQVVGVPDEKFGEVAAVWIRLKADASATEGEMREYCHGRIAHFKVPQYFRFVEGFPMTVTGKIQKFKIRETEIAERGLEKAAGIRTA